MNLPFENFDGDTVKENGDQRISTGERALITIVASLAKLVLWRVQRAKTYEDLYKIVRFVEKKSDILEEKLETFQGNTNEDYDVIMSELEIVEAELTVENQSEH